MNLLPPKPIAFGLQKLDLFFQRFYPAAVGISLLLQLLLELCISLGENGELLLEILQPDLRGLGTTVSLLAEYINFLEGVVSKAKKGSI